MLDRLEKTIGKYAIPQLATILAGGQLLSWAWIYMQPQVAAKLVFVPALVMQGEVWRLLTFPILSIPDGSMLGNVGAIFQILLTYMFGRVLEQHLGNFRFNLFIGLGWVASCALSFIEPTTIATNWFFISSVLFGFAYLHPDYEILMMFILPVKVKWFALLDVALCAYFVYAGLVAGSFSSLLLAIGGTVNVFVFFGPDALRRARGQGRRVRHKAAVKAAEKRPTHTCTTCGKTDLDDASLSFRYCSTCVGSHCYCMEHLKAHEHVAADA